MSRQHHRHRHGGVRWRIQKRMFGRIFVGFLFTMLLTALAMTAYHAFTGGARARFEAPERVGAFVAHRFEAVWDDPAKRDELATELSDAFALGITLYDAGGAEILRRGERCRDASQRIVQSVLVRGVQKDRRMVQVGHFEACLPPTPFDGRRARGLGGLLVAFGAIALGVFFLARRLARPMVEVARVAEAIGQGDLGARVKRHHRHAAEVDVVGEQVNRMAGRIEKEVQGQRTLLATVSHEMRTPLGHLRLLTEMARSASSEAARNKALDEIDTEVEEMAALTDGLLTHSRLAFDVVDKAPHDAVALVTQQLARIGRDDILAQVLGSARLVVIDANLVAHAVSNLCTNAQRHGEGLVALTLDFTDPAMLTVTVDDAGEGVAPQNVAKLFEPFQGTGRKKGGLGLGLSLVRRVAEVHGGEVQVTTRPTGPGARFVLTLRTAPSA